MIKLQSIAIGVLFKKAFRVLDGWGEIVDSIIFDEHDHNFDNHYFPQVQAEGFDRVLFSPETKNSLRLTSDNLIYTHNFPDMTNIDSERKSAISKFMQSIAPKVLTQYKLAISRLGIVYTISIDKDQYDKFREMYFKENIRDITAFRFSVKSGTLDSLKSRDTYDFINKIYTVQNDEVGFSISYDYQQHFAPLRGCWIDSKPEAFFSSSWSAFQIDVANCIGSEQIGQKTAGKITTGAYPIS